MAATYTRVSRSIASPLRYGTVSTVVAGDQIDITDLLGRTANQIKIIPHNTGDVITVRYNGRIEVPHYDGEAKPRVTTVEVWLTSIGSVAYTGSSEFLSPDDLKISSIEVVSITFAAGGTSITIGAW